jgi:hypothetical protein
MSVKNDPLAPSIRNGYMIVPALAITVNRDEFHQTPIERGAAFTAKVNHKKELRQAYGKNWKKHLNVPEKKLSGPMRMQF